MTLPPINNNNFNFAGKPMARSRLKADFDLAAVMDTSGTTMSAAQLQALAYTSAPGLFKVLNDAARGHYSPIRVLKLKKATGTACQGHEPGLDDQLLSMELYLEEPARNVSHNHFNGLGLTMDFHARKDGHHHLALMHIANLDDKGTPYNRQSIYHKPPLTSAEIVKKWLSAQRTADVSYAQQLEETYKAHKRAKRDCLKLKSGL